MNALVLFPEELIEPCGAQLRGERARNFLNQQSLAQGQEIRVAVLRSFCALATVTAIDSEQVTLSLGPALPPPPRLPLSLFVAVPRPQTVKKVISLAVQTGIEQLYFVRSHHSVASYLQSHSLRSADIEREILKALEQVWDCIPPVVSVVDRMGDFFTTYLPALNSDTEPVALVLGEPRSDTTRSLGTLARQSPFSRVVLGIGPEKGWSPAEQTGFRDAGFSLVHLGAREYRVETALALFIGQFQMIIQDS